MRHAFRLQPGEYRMLGNEAWEIIEYRLHQTINASALRSALVTTVALRPNVVTGSGLPL